MPKVRAVLFDLDGTLVHSAATCLFFIKRPR